MINFTRKISRILQNLLVISEGVKTQAAPGTVQGPRTVADYDKERHCKVYSC